jgi:hypothetical protein
MIMETAFMEIVPGKELEFEAAMEQAKAVVSQAKGFQVIHVHRGVEKPSTYLIAIGWDGWFSRVRFVYPMAWINRAIFCKPARGIALGITGVISCSKYWKLPL